jgi:hypothetical protein
MKNSTCIIEPSTRKRLETQGYVGFSDEQLAAFKFGIRFAYALCLTLFVSGLLLANITLLTIAAVIAFLAVFPPYHPFDYLYNYGVRHLLNKPKLPPRTNQGRFACGIASVWLATIIICLDAGYIIATYTLGGMLFAVALLVTTTDICIPSMIYNLIFPRKLNH